MPKAQVVSERIEVCETYLNNCRPGKSTPSVGESWEYYLFCLQLQTRRTGKGDFEHCKPFIHTITAPTRKGADDALVDYIEQPQVTIVGDDDYQRRRERHTIRARKPKDVTTGA